MNMKLQSCSDEEDLQALVHDLKNIIMGACGNLTLLRSQKVCDPEVYESVRKVEKMLLEAGYLARSVLQKPQSEDQAEEERLSVLDMIETTAAVCIAPPNIRFQCSWDSPLPLLTAKTLVLKRVFRDLFTNAVEELHEGGEIGVRLFPVEDAEAFCGLKTPAKAFLGIELTDSGGGIPLEHQERVFEKGFTTRDFGSGMGLFSTRQRIQKLGGSIELVLREGAGATFRIVLPATEDVDSRTAGELSLTNKVSSRVLLLDDDLMIRQIVAQMLEHMGVEVSATETPEEALRCYQEGLEQKRRYDLVIIDLNLGDEKGGESIAPQIKALDPEAYLVVTSGWDRDPRISNFKEYGFSACLRKPFTLEELKCLVEEVGKRP